MDVLIGEAQLRERVSEMAGEIRRTFGPDVPVHFVSVLKGAFIFLADLVRAMEGPVTLDFIAVSSYGSGTTSSGEVRLTKDLDVSIEGHDVILVEDIVDSGRTIHYLRRNLETRHPRSLEVCTLLDKVERRQVEVTLDYVGFVIPDRFVVGYGFDLAGHYRGLPEIHSLED